MEVHACLRNIKVDGRRPSCSRAFTVEGAYSNYMSLASQKTTVFRVSPESPLLSLGWMDRMISLAVLLWKLGGGGINIYCVRPALPSSTAAVLWLT